MRQVPLKPYSRTVKLSGIQQQLVYGVTLSRSSLSALDYPSYICLYHGFTLVFDTLKTCLLNLESPSHTNLFGTGSNSFDQRTPVLSGRIYPELVVIISKQFSSETPPGPSLCPSERDNVRALKKATRQAHARGHTCSAEINMTDSSAVLWLPPLPRAEPRSREIQIKG